MVISVFPFELHRCQTQSWGSNQNRTTDWVCGQGRFKWWMVTSSLSYRESPAIGIVGNTGFLCVSVASLSRGIQAGNRSEEHTSELQSRENLVCRLLLEKK